MVARVAKFGLVGLVNTAVGYGVIVACQLFGMNAYLANAIGYLAGLILSFVLNRSITFERKGPAPRGEIGRFGLAVLCAYLANVGMLFVGQQALGQNSLVAQLAAVLAYAVSFYGLSARFVFSRAE